MKKKDGISRRQFLSTSIALTAGGLFGGKLFGQNKDGPSVPSAKQGTRVVLLGTGGGPRPNKMRNQSSWVVVVNDIPYVVDCGGGVSKQMAMAGIPLTGLKHIFITHHHSDHNLEYGGLIYNAWVSGFKGRIDSWGPPPLDQITKSFFQTNQYDIKSGSPMREDLPLCRWWPPTRSQRRGW